MKIKFGDYEFDTTNLGTWTNLATNPDLAKAHFEKYDNNFCGDNGCDYCHEAYIIICMIEAGVIKKA
jgi:hypothetical protein